MSRITVNDLNSMMGYNQDEVQQVFVDYSKAHYKLYNRCMSWIDNFNKLNNASTYNTYKLYKKLYYESSILLTDIDLFEDNVNGFISVLTKVKQPEYVSNVRKMMYMLNQQKINIIDKKSICYDMYSEAYTRLEEYYEE